MAPSPGGLPEHLMPVPVGQRKLSRDVIEEHQRAHVLTDAIEVFAKRGYLGTTVDHLVGAAKIGVGTFYSLFDGKEDCFLQAFDRITEDAHERIATAVPPDAPWPEQVAVAVRELLELIAAEPFSARVALVEAQTAGPKALARYEQHIDEIVPLLRRCREASPLSDELPPTLEEATLGGVVWVLHQRLVMGRSRGIEGLLPELVDVLIAPYLGEDEAARIAGSLTGAASAAR